MFKLGRRSNLHCSLQKKKVRFQHQCLNCEEEPGETEEEAARGCCLAAILSGAAVGPNFLSVALAECHLKI